MDEAAYAWPSCEDMMRVQFTDFVQVAVILACIARFLRDNAFQSWNSERNLTIHKIVATVVIRTLECADEVGPRTD